MLGLAILILWETKAMKRIKLFQLIQGPLVVVILGIILNTIFAGNSDLLLSPNQIVNIPVSATIGDFFSQFRFPDFSQIGNPSVYFTAVVIAIVGSIETLLCVEASDKQDPLRRITPTNQELRAQGVGNFVSGLIGGLPVTQVIVRSSVNAQAGGKTKASAIFHGFLIILSIIFIPNLLNLIPLASLAAILLVVGYKLAKPALFKKIYNQGIGQFIPFVATIAGIVFTDLLKGIGIGLVVSIFFILYRNFKLPIVVEQEIEKDGKIEIELTEDVSFLKKASLLRVLAEIPDNRKVIINAKKTQYVHQDVIGIIEDFQISAKSRNIEVQLVELYEHKQQDPVVHFKIKH